MIYWPFLVSKTEQDILAVYEAAVPTTINNCSPASRRFEILNRYWIKELRNAKW